jgi:glycosyltransferase involved in cell wall biosynthesis
VRAEASSEVLFPGAVYEKRVVESLRFHSLFYMHGHQVGGCNPSLLEAMGAGNPVIAHDNRFNRWVVRDGALYFSDQRDCERVLDEFLGNGQRLAQMARLNRRRVRDVFNWNEILLSYAELLTDVSTKVTADDEPGWGRRSQWQLDTDAL